MEKNYFDVIMNESFELLTSKRVCWPFELNDQQRTELLEKCLIYFSEKEEYTKCTELQKKIQSLNKRNKIKKGYGNKKKN